MRYIRLYIIRTLFQYWMKEIDNLIPHPSYFRNTAAVNLNPLSIKTNNMSGHAPRIYHAWVMVAVLKLPGRLQSVCGSRKVHLQSKITYHLHPQWHGGRKEPNRHKKALTRALTACSLPSVSLRICGHLWKCKWESSDIKASNTEARHMLWHRGRFNVIS